jgi:hypothetical protein
MGGPGCLPPVTSEDDTEASGGSPKTESGSNTRTLGEPLSGAASYKRLRG